MAEQNNDLIAGRNAVSEALRSQRSINKILLQEGAHGGSLGEIIALAKMTFTGEDVPNNVIVLAGKNFLENIQCRYWHYCIYHTLSCNYHKYLHYRTFLLDIPL